MSTILQSTQVRPTAGISWKAPALATSFLLPWILHASHLLNYFYDRGTALCDTGLFASLLWHPTWTLRLPASVVDPGTGDTFCALNPSDTFFATHVSPWFTLLGAPSHLLPGGPTAWFVFVHALLMAMTGVIGFIAIRRTAIDTGVLRPLPGWMLAQVFAFNGIVLTAITAPHFELLIPCALLLVFLALPGRGLRAALPLLLLAQLLREDVGLHAALLALALVVARRLDGGAWRGQRELLVLAATGIGLSLCMMIVQRVAFGGGGSLQKVYLGDPIYAHLSMSLFLERLGFFLVDRAYVMLLFPATLAYALWRRSWVPLAAVASCVPWLVLHMLAIKKAPSELFTYYAFPMMTAYLWPLVGEAFIDPRRAEPAGPSPDAARRVAVRATFALLVLSALTTPFYTLRNFIVSAIPQEGMRHAARTERFLDTVLRDPRLGTVVLDFYAASLRPVGTPFSRVWGEGHQPNGDTFVFHEKWKRRPFHQGELARLGVSHCHALPGTPFRIATRGAPPETLSREFELKQMPVEACDGMAEKAG